MAISRCSTAKHRFTIKDASINEQETVAWSPDGERLATIAPDKTVMIWDAVTGEGIRKLVGHEHRGASMWPGARTASIWRHRASTRPGTITIWDVETGERTRALESGQFNLLYCLEPRQHTSGRRDIQRECLGVGRDQR